jgi:hypothetical protein
MQKVNKLIGISITIILLSSSLAIANSELIEKSQEKTLVKTAEKLDGIPYTGNLKLYVVEPTSRWDNYDGNPYHYGFLDYALDEDLSIAYQDTYGKDVTWDPSAAGYNNVNPNNLMIIAAVFNPEAVKRYAYPPSQYPFMAHYVDASAAAIPGETGANEVTEDFTHTVFVEEATATWCPYCPLMAEALNSVYDSGDYPYYFAAMITDKSDVAAHRCQEDLNVYGYPTAYFDGGRKVLVGGYDETSYYETRIEQCGAQDVHELDLSILVYMNQDDTVGISVTIVNNEEVTNEVPEIPTITGDVNGNAGDEYEYTFVSTDPNGHDLYYCIDWGDGTDEICIGPFASGEEVTSTHTWEDRDTYIIRVKARDAFDAESDWATLEVSMPHPNMRSTIFNKLQQILERFQFGNLFSFFF